MDLIAATRTCAYFRTCIKLTICDWRQILPIFKHCLYSLRGVFEITFVLPSLSVYLFCYDKFQIVNQPR